MGVKTALDLEILTYRKMLEGEETRCGKVISSSYNYYVNLTDTS